MSDAKLPVHGFVLAGGKSTRMGRDKALLEIGERPMAEIAIRKLESFCAEVSIAGNRDDLGAFGAIVPEERVGAGPAAGIEAGLRAARQPWALFVPVDVPLVPADLLRMWAAQVLREPRVVVGHLYVFGDQPAFCMIRSGCGQAFTAALETGERKLARLFDRLVQSGGVHRVYSVRELYGAGYPGDEVLRRMFMNVNTPEELAIAQHCTVES
ncbi:MAG TPA: molybdenum cofactor guanylyltransferase [Acidobacteriaceae bacterium]|nr:molybdenum cofactor guanylyltransferase [Acidobacteriaceae bacterium]